MKHRHVTLNGPTFSNIIGKNIPPFFGQDFTGFSNKLEDQKGEGHKSKRLEHFLTKKTTVT